MSIVERDRAAAFFAHNEEGSQVLICSEIGSEGRNFQFAHHLILFDLPLNPDLLEQRIGRLDRIGQSHRIQIHVPYLQNSAQAVMYHWYHEGLQAFEHTCPAGHNVFVKVQATLIESLHQIDDGMDDLATLISTTQALHHDYNQDLQQGRDRLLEYSSCRPQIANELVDQALQQTEDKALANYLDAVFDNFGIDTEIHSATSFVITPGDHVRTSLPGLSEDGMTITYHRATALANEDMHYLSWEHPLTLSAMDAIISSEIGNTTMVTIKHPAIKPGTLLLECVYNLAPASSKRLDSARYLPASSIRIVCDQKGRQLQAHLSETFIEQVQERVHHEVANKVVKAHTATLKDMLNLSEAHARQAVPPLLSEAKNTALQTYRQEIDRLQALKTVNPNIRQAELDHFIREAESIQQQLSATVAQLDAIRVMIVTE
jgi:ATP-dependent helicase HepA